MDPSFLSFHRAVDSRFSGRCLAFPDLTLSGVNISDTHPLLALTSNSKSAINRDGRTRNLAVCVRMEHAGRRQGTRRRALVTTRILVLVRTITGGRVAGLRIDFPAKQIIRIAERHPGEREAEQQKKRRETGDAPESALSS